MESNFLQSDFGSFNPRFMGVTVHFDNTESLGTFFSFLGVPTDLPSNQDPLEKAIIRSVHAHEYRHYHDFLLGSYSTALFGARLQATLNGTQALRLLPELPGRILPVPLCSWLSMEDHERRIMPNDWLCNGESQINNQTGIVNIPYIPKRELSNLKLKRGLYIEGDVLQKFLTLLCGATSAYLQIEEIVK